MKQRQLIWLGAALIILVFVAYLAGTFDDEISTVEVPELTIPADEVHTIRVIGPEMALGVRRENGAWHLTEPVQAPADSAEVRSFLEDASALRLQSVVSTNPERYGRYGVDSTAAEVTLEWDGGTQTMVVSEEGPGFDSNYIRLEGDESVYATAGGLRLPAEADAWRDPKIVDLTPEHVAAVSVEGPDLSYQLREEGDTSWVFAARGTTYDADSAATARYLQRFAPLEGDGFLEEPSAERDSTYTVRFSLVDGTERTLILRPSGNDDIAVTVDGGDTVYRLRKLRLPQITPDASYFTNP